MASLFHALRGNAHALNYVLIATAALVPIIAYGQFRAPSSLDVEQRLQEAYGADVQRNRRHTDDIAEFWRTKRSSRAMDDVYSDLLRSGAGGSKRHYPLTGRLASAEDADDPKMARMRALLAIPPPPSSQPQPSQSEPSQPQPRQREQPIPADKTDGHEAESVGSLAHGRPHAAPAPAVAVEGTSAPRGAMTRPTTVAT